MKMFMERRLSLVLVLIFAFYQVFVPEGLADDVKVCTLTLNVPEVYSLILADNAIADTTDAGNFTDGYIDLSQTSATCITNNKWKLSLKTDGFDAVGGYNKPVTDILIKTTGLYGTTYNSDYSPVESSGVDYSVATNKDPALSDVTGINYRILLDQDDIVGTYVISFVYTLSTNTE